MTAAGVAALLADRYRLVERIAVGGMGEVWRAEDTLLGRVVAVKTLKPEYLGDDDFRARFRAEARHAGRLAHPGIASVYDFGEAEDCAWLVMELVDGEPLSGVLRREGRLSAERTLDVVAQAATALQAAHDGGVVHRDVKPGNLLVRRDGVLKVTDFGIAAATDAVPLTQTGVVVGTAYYLSPEQAAGRSGSPASDVYALGVVAYECLAGARPFPGTNPVAVALAHVRSEPPVLPAAVPSGVRDLVARALAKDPAERFPHAEAMARRALELRAELLDDSVYPDDQGGLAGVPVVPPSAAVDEQADALTQVGPVPTHRIDRVLQVDAATAPPRVPGSRARSSRSAVRASGILLVALAAVLGLGAGIGTPDEAAPATAGEATPSEPPSPSAQPEAVRVDPSEYVGRPAVEARAALADRGLVPRLAYDGSGTPVGTVSDVEPSGPVVLGTAVLLHVVPEPPAVPAAPDPAPVEVAPAPVEKKGPPPGKGPAAGGNGNKGRGNR